MNRHPIFGRLVLRHPYHQPQPEGPVMPASRLVTRIENDIHAGIADVHDVLTHHLSTVNLLNELAQRLSAAESNPVMQALEASALPPAAVQMVAGWVHDLAGVTQHLDQAAQPVAPAAPVAAGDADEPEPAT